MRNGHRKKSRSSGGVTSWTEMVHIPGPGGTTLPTTFDRQPCWCVSGLVIYLLIMTRRKIKIGSCLTTSWQHGWSNIRSRAPTDPKTTSGWTIPWVIDHVCVDGGVWHPERFEDWTTCLTTSSCQRAENDHTLIFNLRCCHHVNMRQNDFLCVFI